MSQLGQHGLGASSAAASGAVTGPGVERMASAEASQVSFSCS